MTFFQQIQKKGTTKFIKPIEYIRLVHLCKESHRQAIICKHWQKYINSRYWKINLNLTEIPHVLLFDTSTIPEYSLNSIYPVTFDLPENTLVIPLRFSDFKTNTQKYWCSRMVYLPLYGKTQNQEYLATRHFPLLCTQKKSQNHVFLNMSFDMILKPLHK